MRLHPRIWKILRSRRTRIAAACSPFVLLIGIVAFYAGVNAWAAHAQKKFFAELPARGYAANIDAYFHGGSEAGTDVFQHPAMQEERAKDSISQSFEKGGLVSKHPGTKRDLSTQADLIKLLTPAPADEKEAARQLLALDPGLEAHWRDLRHAFSRPDAAWPGGSLIEAVTSVLNVRSFANYAKVHALAEMVEGNRAEALEDVQTLIDLERHALSSRPTMVSILVGSLLQSNVSDVVWEGVHRGAWDDAALDQILDSLAVLDPTHSAVAALRGELVLMASGPPAPDEEPTGMQYLKGFDWKQLLTVDWKEAAPRWRAVWICIRPSGFLKLDQIRVAGNYMAMAHLQNGQPRQRFDLADLKAFRANLEASPAAEFVSKGGASSLWQENSPWFFLVNQVEAALQIQAQLETLRTGIALERFRLKNDSYPDSLEALVPAYLPAVPFDPFAEKPLRYRRQADGSPLVWSIGKNLIDDTGIPNRNSKMGDVIWITQPIPGFTEKDYRR